MRSGIARPRFLLPLRPPIVSMSGKDKRIGRKFGSRRPPYSGWSSLPAAAGVCLIRRAGGSTASELYAGGKRFAEHLRNGLTPIVFYLGDHDPSGLAMTGILRKQFRLYAKQEVEVQRLALGLDQVLALDLPPNPAKESDSRYQQYVLARGRLIHGSWMRSVRHSSTLRLSPPSATLSSAMHGPKRLVMRNLDVINFAA
jgi:hypothetical protein